MKQPPGSFLHHSFESIKYEIMKKIILTSLFVFSMSIVLMAQNSKIIADCNTSFSYSIYYTVECLTPCLPVSFVDKSSGDIVNWHWYFSDSSFSDQQNPMHIFNKGNYRCGEGISRCIPVFQACLTTTTSTGCESTSCQKVTSYVDTVPSCNVDFNYYDMEPVLDRMIRNDSSDYYKYIRFDGISGDDVVTWKWDFGDGTTSNEQNPSHSFYVPPTYCKNSYCISSFTVCLTIATSNGCVNSICKEIALTSPVGPACEVKFNYYQLSKDSLYYLNPIKYDSSENSYYIKFYSISNNDVVAWKWDFGDSTMSTEQNPLHCYNIGNYKCGYTKCVPTFYVCLTITTRDGCTAYFYDVVNPVTPYPSTCESKFTAVNLNSDPTKFIFTNNSLWEGGTVLWSFGDGTFSYEENPLHDFQNYSYPIDCMIIVDPPFDSVMPYSPPVDTLYAYNNKTNNRLVFMPPYENKFYTVCLTITSANGCISTSCQDVYVLAEQPKLCDNFIKLNTQFVLGGTNCNGYVSASLVDKYDSLVPYKEINWSTGATSQGISYVCSNITYTVSITNMDNCITSGTFALSDYSSNWFIQYQSYNNYYNFQYLNYKPEYSYQWNFCDSTYENGYEVNKYIGNSNCWAEVTVTDQTGNVVNQEKILITNTGTDIPAAQSEDVVLLYPIPASNVINISYHQRLQAGYTVEINDVMGRCVMRNIIHNGNNITTLNINTLSKGTYFCRILDGSKTYTTKFIK
jgi:PKD repeat protein